MPLTAAQQLKLDTDLLNAIRRNKALDVSALISAGASPFAILKPIDRKEKDYDLFLEVIISRDTAVFKAVLAHAKSTGHVIDLGRNILSDRRDVYHLSYPMNIFQLCSSFGGATFINALSEYAEATKQNSKVLINKPIVYTDERGNEIGKVHFGSVLMTSLNAELLGANFLPTDTGAKSIETAKRILSNWINRRSEEGEFTLETPFEITWKGPIKNLKALIDLGLNVNAVTDGQDLETLIKLMCSYAKDPKEFAEFVKQGKIQFRGITVTAIGTDANGKVVLDVTAKNKRGLFPIPFKITLDFDEALELVQTAVKASPLTRRVDALENRVYTMSESLLEDARESLTDNPNALHCFNVLQREIEGFLLGNQIAKTGRFEIKPTTQSAMIIKNAHNILSAVGQLSGFSSIAFAVTELLVNEATQAYARKQVKGVLNATEGMNFSKVATKLAVMLTNRAMASFAHITDSTISSLVSKVKVHFDDLHNFQNPAQLMLHVFQESTKALPAPRLSDHSGSTPLSNSSGGNQQHSGEELQWGYAAIKAKSEEAKKSKSVLRFVPGYSCMHPSM